MPLESLPERPLMTAPFSSRAFRDALGCFATGVAVATTCAPEGSPIGLTINSFASVSLDPPLVLFSLDRRSTHLAAFENGVGFAINILSEAQRAVSERFAGPESERWANQPWTPDPVNGLPVLPGSAAHLSCTAHAYHDGGDHIIVVGHVRWLDFHADRPPLLYLRGAYARAST
jgi:flavin reductase (DIM6/NTAB) family NADH-FMN oxidoreductase RutF